MSPKKNALGADLMTEWYMQDFLEHGERPKNVYLFAKNHDFKESEFYQYFGSFEGLESGIFETFFKKTMQLLHEDENYSSYDAQAKLLGFYYTFFEMMTANRSFVKMVLGQEIQNAFGWKPMLNIKEHFSSFLGSIELNQINLPMEGLENWKDKTETEIIWNHFLCIVHFWLKDESPQFEKTDTFIEKSIVTGFELMNTTPLEKLFDLGKFILKEMPHNMPDWMSSWMSSNSPFNSPFGKMHGKHK